MYTSNFGSPLQKIKIQGQERSARDHSHSSTFEEMAAAMHSHAL